MSIVIVIGTIECDGCYDSFDIDLVEFVGCTWGDHPDIELPDGWARDGDHHYCGFCSSWNGKGVA